MIFRENDLDLAALDHLTLAAIIIEASEELTTRIRAGEAELEHLDLLTVPEAAVLIGYTRQHLALLCREGRITHWRYDDGGYGIPRAVALAHRAKRRMPTHYPAATTTHDAA